MGTRLRHVLILMFAALAGCTLLDRQGPPEILEIRTDYGTNPFVGRGRRVSITVVTTDPDNDELDFRWIASGGEFEATKRDTFIDLFQDSVTVVWNAPGITGVYDLALEVADGLSPEIVTAAVRVTVTQGPPSADAGAPRVVNFESGLVVQLDGTASEDPDNDDLRFIWEQIAGPVVPLSDPGGPIGNPQGPTPEFEPPAPADYVFTLRVADDLAPGKADTSGVSTVTIRVTDREGPALGG